MSEPSGSHGGRRASDPAASVAGSLSVGSGAAAAKRRSSAAPTSRSSTVLGAGRDEDVGGPEGLLLLPPNEVDERKHVNIDTDPSFQANKVWRRRKSLTRRRSLILDAIVGDEITRAVDEHAKTPRGAAYRVPPSPVRPSTSGVDGRPARGRAPPTPGMRPDGEPEVPVAFGRTNKTRRRGLLTKRPASLLYSPMPGRRRSRLPRTETTKVGHTLGLLSTRRRSNVKSLRQSKSMPAMSPASAAHHVGVVKGVPPSRLKTVTPVAGLHQVLDAKLERKWREGGHSSPPSRRPRTTPTPAARGGRAEHFMSPTHKAKLARRRRETESLAEVVRDYNQPGLVFPEALRRRDDFKSLLDSNINAVHGRRQSAAHFLKFVAGIDTELSMEHYTGPARSRNLRRNAILDVSRSQRATEAPAPEKAQPADPNATADNNAGGELDLPWEGANGLDEEEEAEVTHTSKKRATDNRFAVPMRSDMDFAEAERYLQRAFVVRARTFGVNDEATALARTNLLKCYIAQNKMDDIKEIRDHVKQHLVSLERQLADFETDLRRSRLRAKMVSHARAMGAQSLAAARQSADTLELRDDPRPVKSMVDLSSPARFHGEFADNRVIEYNALKSAPSPYTAATMMFPQHQAGARIKEERAQRAQQAQSQLSPGRRKSTISASPLARKQSMRTLPSSPTAASIANASGAGGAGAGAGAGVDDPDGAEHLSPVRARRLARDRDAMRPQKVGGSAPPSADPVYNEDRGVTVSVPARKFRADAQEQLRLTNYERAADSCRKGLTLNSGDASLRAMFRASLGKLSEYPRREDFNADLELFADSDAILGERLVVRYKYAHRAMPGKRHTPLDWVGLFKVISPGGALDSAVDAFNASTHSAVGTPASRRARQKEREERRRRGDGESKSGQTTPAQSVTTSPSRSLSPSRHFPSRPMSAADKRNRMYELQAKEEERKRIQEEKARLEAERKAKEDPVKALGDPTLNFGDEPVAPQHREVLVGWTLAPPGNEGAVAFEGIPTEAGHYRVRYFVHGSQCPLGEPSDVYARLVDIELSAPDRLYCGDRLPVKYKMHYRDARHGPNDWAGLYVIPASKEQEDEVDWTPYVFTHPIEVVKLPPDNEGIVYFVDHPVYPGLYEIRFFIHQDVDSCVGITHPIMATLPFTHFSRKAPLLRELRFYLAAPFTCSDEERDVLARIVMPHIRSVCEERCVTPVLVDLRAQLSHYHGKPIKLGDMAETFFQEIDDCRPMVLMVMGQGYGWIPQGFSSAVSHLFPWVRHHDNPAVPRQSVAGRKKGSLLGAMKSMLGGAVKSKPGALSKAVAKGDVAEDNDAERPVPVHASLLELEMVSALRLPELQLDGSGGPLTAHCHIYTRHPSLHSGIVNLPDPHLIPDPQLPQRTADAALTHWRNVCAKRGWRCRPGYQNMNELADWVVSDILAAVDEHWPKRKLPPPHLLWTMSSMAFSHMRKSFAVVSELRVAQMQRLTAYATSVSPPNRPFCVVGPSGCGKSQLIALWSALLYHKSRPGVVDKHHATARAARNVRAATRLASGATPPHGRKRSMGGRSGGGQSGDEDEEDAFDAASHGSGPVTGRSGGSVRVLSPRASLPGAVFHGEGAGTGDGVSGYVSRGSQRRLTGGSTGTQKSGGAPRGLTVNTGNLSPGTRGALSSRGSASRFTFTNAETGEKEKKLEERLNPGQDRVFESLPTCPTYFTAMLNGINYVFLVVHIGENGVPNTAPELMRCICQALAQLSRCGRQANDVDAAVTAGKGLAFLRAAFLQCLEVVLLSHRVVLVLDGLDRMEDCAQSKGTVVEPQGEAGGDPAAGGAAASGSGAGGPPALWWFPAELPLGLHLIVSIRPINLGWATVNARGWSRDRIEVPLLSEPETKEILHRAFGRGGVGNEWSQNHGTRFRYWLDLPVSTRNMTILAEEALAASGTTVREKARASKVTNSLSSLLSKGVKNGASSTRSTASTKAKPKLAPGTKPPPDPNVVPPKERVATMVGEPLSEVLKTWFCAHEVCRNPLWLRVALARLCTTRTTVAALATARMLVTEDLRTMIGHLLRDCRHPLALDAMRLILVSRCGLQECEIVDMLGGARYRRRERRGSAVQAKPGAAAQDSKLEDTFYAPTQKERNRNLGHDFDAVAWSRARRWLLAAFVGRGRGLWTLDHAVVREAVKAQLQPTTKSAIPWMQRIASYFWTQPAGRRKAEELPFLLVRLHGLALRAEAAKEAREERSRASSTAAARIGLSRRGPRRTSIGAVVRLLNASRRPSSLIVGLPVHEAFPLDSKRCQERLLQCLQDVTMVSELRGSGASLHDALLQGFKLIGKPATTIVNLVRQSFEHYHAITGFHKRPHYQFARGALIDPDFLAHQQEEKKREQEREAKMKSSKKREVWAPRRKQDTSDWVRVTQEQWDHLRRTGCRQLLHMAHLFDELGATGQAYTSVESSLLLNYGHKFWDTLVANLKAEAQNFEMTAPGNSDPNGQPHVVAANLVSKRTATQALLLAMQLLYKRLQYCVARDQAAPRSSESEPRAGSPPRRHQRNAAAQMLVPLTEMTVTQLFGRIRGVKFVASAMERMIAPTPETKEALDIFGRAQRLMGQAYNTRRVSAGPRMHKPANVIILGQREARKQRVRLIDKEREARSRSPDKGDHDVVAATDDLSALGLGPGRGAGSSSPARRSGSRRSVRKQGSRRSVGSRRSGRS